MLSAAKHPSAAYAAIFFYPTRSGSHDDAFLVVGL